MKIEEEIKQKKFNSEFNKLAVNILYTYGWLNSFITEKLSEYGLSPQQYNILRILRGQGNDCASIGLLKERMLDKTPDVSRMIDRLLKKGFVSREISCEDRRRADVKISEQGLILLEKIDEISHVFDEKLMTISEKEAVELNLLLDKLRG